ncbi:MAG: polyprenol monophosphomannose synthase [Bacteroidales bacterium]|jgi:dolichol-phosphate mannosyltransferase|nr:polyprenol monophosphomannose synthase [Bacteroidales bacterium]
MSDSIVIIPTYNEKENIENIIRKVFSLEKDFDILVIDDASPDGTYDIVKGLIEQYPVGRLSLERRNGKMGLGTAYLHGFKWAIENNYDYIFEMDADFSHNPEDLIKLYNACLNGADLAIGSRYVKGKISVVNWPIQRVIMSYYASYYVRLILGLTIGDATAGFVCYRKQLLENINLNKVKFVGYAFQIEMKYTAFKLGFKIEEVPIIFIDRVLGQSKMSMKIFKEAFFGVWSLRFRNWKKYKLRK